MDALAFQGQPLCRKGAGADERERERKREREAGI